MDEKDSGGREAPIFNLEKLSGLLSQYKFPLIFGGFGLLLLFLSLAVLLKNQTEKGDVLFSTNESTGSATLKIDIQGSVMTPGVYNLKEGSRIMDALSSAGGLSADADREYLSKYLNRAAKLTDGQKIYIPSAGETASGKSPFGSAQGKQNNLGDLSNLSQKKLNINTASQAELEVLPGVGPVTAGKIISGRPYQTIEELKNRKIVGNALFEKIKDLISVF